MRQAFAYEHGITTVVLTDFREVDEDLRDLISPPVYNTGFNSPGLGDWLCSPDHWHVRDGVLCSRGEGSEIITLKPCIWQDCRISYRVRYLSGTDAWVSFRGNYLSEPRGYSYFQLDSGSLKIRHNNLKQWRDISEIVPAQVDNKWHKVECFLNGPMAECFVDGEFIVSTRQCPVNIGMVGFRTLNTKIEIDDFRVDNLAEEFSEQLVQDIPAL